MSIPPLASPESGIPASPQSVPQTYGEPVPTHLAPAVFITILCCLPAGIAAVYYASRVASLQAVGNRSAALLASDRAKLWCWIGAIIGIIWPIILISTIITSGMRIFHALQSLFV